ncbi:single-stranded DNA-binding protein [Mucilaginibacter jinjuensis]|uniref:Single-stranded DNA-binding protein n=1 Tax=Mucilaginibacter jinjuensis TaxID=1176721 RepID=A0ABY7T8J0_9SPHI|nr:single-stranded DNA-binding protein [Mucilaginibacter jinjuensis]WCT12549.1 single-stranded DNA-binding protein [Mucilaginibacter jinjuensis]
MLSNSGINKVFLVGYIGKEPRWHSANNEPKMLCFPMVTTEFIKKNGTSVEHVEWHQIKIPENFVEDETLLKKGQLVYVQGKIQTRQFTDEQQVKRYKTEILAQQVQLLNSTIESTLL